MYNEEQGNSVSTGGGLVGAKTPKVASSIENELQGLTNATEQLFLVVSELANRLYPALKETEPIETKEASNPRQILAPLPNTIRAEKKDMIKCLCKEILEAESGRKVSNLIIHLYGCPDDNEYQDYLKLKWWQKITRQNPYKFYREHFEILRP